MDRVYGAPCRPGTNCRPHAPAKAGSISAQTRMGFLDMLAVGWRMVAPEAQGETSRIALEPSIRS